MKVRHQRALARPNRYFLVFVSIRQRQTDRQTRQQSLLPQHQNLLFFRYARKK